MSSTVPFPLWPSRAFPHEIENLPDGEVNPPSNPSRSQGLTAMWEQYYELHHVLPLVAHSKEKCGTVREELHQVLHTLLDPSRPEDELRLICERLTHAHQLLGLNNDLEGFVGEHQHDDSKRGHLYYT